MIRAWVTEEMRAREVAPAEAVRHIVERSGYVWIDFDCEDERAARETLAPLAIHDLVLEDMVMQVNRPKVDNYGSYLYLVLHSARWDEDRAHLRELDFVVGDRYLITYHDGSTRSIAAAHEVLARRPELLAAGPGPLLHFILDLLVDHYLPIMDKIADEIDEIEERVLDPRASAEYARVLQLKRGMSALRRIVGPQRDTLLALTRDEFRAIPPEMRPYLRDVFDRLARVNDLLDSFRDEVASVMELQAATTSNRLNEVIKRLTVIATVGLPFTVITSYYGMNFDFGEYHWRFGGPYVLGLLAASALATWWVLKRKRWL